MNLTVLSNLKNSTILHTQLVIQYTVETFILGLLCHLFSMSKLQDEKKHWLGKKATMDMVTNKSDSSKEENALNLYFLYGLSIARLLCEACLDLNFPPFLSSLFSKGFLFSHS